MNQMIENCPKRQSSNLFLFNIYTAAYFQFGERTVKLILKETKGYTVFFSF